MTRTLSSPELSSAILTIDLDAVTANYRLLQEKVEGKPVNPVVKANAYGLGIDRIAPALYRAGAKTFFVAQIEEGIELRQILPGVEIHILNGLMPGSESVMAEYGLVPVLNTLSQIEAWADYCAAHHRKMAADIHIDTGMQRLGLTDKERERLSDHPALCDAIHVPYIISHLACADTPANPMNGEQLKAFHTALSRLPFLSGAKACLANSSGIFLSPEYHFDAVRPGISLWGGHPQPGDSNHLNPMKQVIRLQGKILQTRDIDTPSGVGYGATHRARSGDRIATVGVGYADGFLRSLGNQGHLYLDQVKVPIVGRISMDLLAVDITQVPGDKAHVGSLVDLIGPHNPVDEMAHDAGTISYELLTGLGNRYHRIYLDGGV